MTGQDDRVLELVAQSFDGVRMARGTDRIVARGRTLRRRRRALPMVAVAGIAAAAALGASSSLDGPPGAVGRSASAPQPVNVDLAAWSVHTDADLTVTVTLRQLRDPDLLRQVLAKAGVHAVVGACLSHGETLPQVTKVLDDPPLRKVAGGFVITVHPAQMPAGSALGFTVAVVSPSSETVRTVAIALYAHTPGQCPS